MDLVTDIESPITGIGNYQNSFEEQIKAAERILQMW